MDDFDLTPNLIDLKLDEENELTFEVSIQGESSGAPPIFRFVCEADDIAYSFRGHAAGANEVTFNLPSMQGKLTEGKYDSHLEVVVDNKLFVPIEIVSNFEIATRVVAEGVRVKNSAKKKTEVTAQAKLVRQDRKKAPKTQAKKPAPPGRTLAEVYENQRKKTR